MGGAFEPTLDRKTQKIVFASLNRQSYDIMIRPGPSAPEDVEEITEAPLLLDRTHYPLYGMSTADFIREPYWANFYLENIFFTLFYTNDIGLSGLVFVIILATIGSACPWII